MALSGSEWGQGIGGEPLLYWFGTYQTCYRPGLNGPERWQNPALGAAMEQDALTETVLSVVLDEHHAALTAARALKTKRRV